MSRYNIYDFLSPKSKERFDAIVAKNEIIVDEETLREAKLARESFRSGSNLILTTVNRHIELKRAPDTRALGVVDQYIMQEDLEHNYNLMIFYVKLRSALNEELINEAVQTFMTQEKIKNFTKELKELLKKENVEKDQAQIQIYLDQRFQHQIQMLEQINAEKKRIIDDIKKINEAQREIRENLAKLETLKESIIDKHSARIAKDLKNYVSPTGMKYFENKSDTQVQAFVKDLIVSERKIDKEIELVQSKKEISLNRIKELEDKKQSIIRDIGSNGTGMSKVTHARDDMKQITALTTMRDIKRASSENSDVRKIDDQINQERSKIEKYDERLQSLDQQKSQNVAVVAKQHQMIEIVEDTPENQKAFSQHLANQKEPLNKEIHEVEIIEERMNNDIDNLQNAKNKEIGMYHGLVNDFSIPQQTVIQNNNKLSESKAKALLQLQQPALIQCSDHLNPAHLLLQNLLHQKILH